MSEILCKAVLPTGQELQIVRGDLTDENVDAIVNAANAHLQHGGGVAGAISCRGGPAIQNESDRWVRQHGPVPHDCPAVTSSGNLPCKYVIHAVGPIYGQGDEDEKLAAAVAGSLRLADQLELTSLALPAISTGIFGFSKQRAARVILSAVLSYFTANPTSGLHLVRLVLIDRPTVDAFTQAWDKQLPEPDQTS